jgi:tetratricopeptide (TPR) repeat protein
VYVNVYPLINILWITTMGRSLRTREYWTMRSWIPNLTARQITTWVEPILLLAVCVFFPAQVRAAATQAPGAQASAPSLGPGMEVILKSTEVPLADAGRLVSSQDRLTFLIERIERDRVLVVSTDKVVRGWIHPDHVVPLENAVRFLSTVIASDRRNAEPHWMRGRLLYYLNEDMRALRSLALAIRLKPDQSRFYVTRSLVYLRMKQIDRAMDDCNQAIDLDPKSSRAYEVRAYVWLAKKDPERAGADLAEALRLDPAVPTGPKRAVPVPDDDDDDIDAIKNLLPGGQPTQPEPETAVQFLDRGNGWFDKSDYDRALADYNAALRLDPRFAPAFVARGHAWARKHYREKEVADCTEAIKLEPGNATYWVARAESWSAQGAHGRAMEDYAEALRLEPKQPAIWVSRGNEWRRELKLDQAIADFTYAAQLNPKYIPAYVARANAWKQRKVFDRAIQEFRALIQLDPENPLAHWSLARILATCMEDNFRNGKWALELASRACELTHWRDPDCLDTLATAYAETGDFPAAIKWQNEAIKLIGQNAPSLLQRRADSFGGQRGLGFADRLAYYQSQKTIRE